MSSLSRTTPPFSDSDPADRPAGGRAAGQSVPRSAAANGSQASDGMGMGGGARNGGGNSRKGRINGGGKGDMQGGAKDAAKDAVKDGAKGSGKGGNAKGGVKGAGDAAEKLRKLGLSRDIDLVLHLPMRYEDETRITPFAQLMPGMIAQIEVRVIDAEVTYRPRRQLVVKVRDASLDEAAYSEPLSLRFLNFYGSQLRQFTPDALLRVRGEVRGGFLGLEMVHPAYRAVEPGAPLPAALTPVYPSTAGISQAYLRKAIDNALSRTPLPELIPAALLPHEEDGTPLDMPLLADAVRALHHPSPTVDEFALTERTHPAWVRIKFDELLAQQLSLARARAERRAQAAPAMPVPIPATATPAAVPTAASLTERLLQALPFTLTAAQRRVCGEISADLAVRFPMQRLLQGDVGSGKTVVAALAATQAIDAGFQVALMAPTEILAEQHARKLRGWLEPLGVTVGWLAGSLGAKAKRAAVEAAASGAAHLTIGTHAIIQDTVDFARLGLTIVDEQHRFGVGQRLALRQKAQGADGRGLLQPHQLMMSATPIPRTLAMTYYADLDVSTIDELPPGRTPILTKIVSDGRRDEVIDRVRQAALRGQQIYWVCPLIEESEALQLQTAVDTHMQLAEALPELQVGLIHGRLPAAEKQTVMEAFASGMTQVLVATTVIEVGVDVPNASLMVIEHAERFGLAQLHQLRGRVGRGSEASACVLLFSQPLSLIARERLKTMRETGDGFEIARRDLEIRGPGELLGARQSGAAMLRFADLEVDRWLVEPAHALAQRLLTDHPALADAHLDRWLASRAHYLKA
ncbi:ATP-dependent DNA helicase RecG [Robbsia sp. Bb-Pol-6]|uniref:ATP-dependent DNA helicase RecG n=1 Tax=Robbsia betulipollinis TaxID=2981849 RepID=A0ABT3ZQP6_9BURK|nr:ATP-dependent DNA helicase RecG [Robbsia betulipollinis]MCY0388856.1 ATP-dependent DNA helicase RecG [Robbsia betulipollinis]